jgi:hypothetical protein
MPEKIIPDLTSPQKVPDLTGSGSASKTLDKVHVRQVFFFTFYVLSSFQYSEPQDCYYGSTTTTIVSVHIIKQRDISVPVSLARREIITVRGQSYVSRLPKY